MVYDFNNLPFVNLQRTQGTYYIKYGIDYCISGLWNPQLPFQLYIVSDSHQTWYVSTRLCVTSIAENEDTVPSIWREYVK